MHTTLPLSLAILGLELPGIAPDIDVAERLRLELGFARGLGIGAVQLDGTRAGMRARELDRSARRELSALLRRQNIGFSGLDLFVPPEHFVSAQYQDRAVSAAGEALELCGELRTLVGEAGTLRGGAAERVAVSVQLPADLPAAVRTHLCERASRAGVALADHTWMKEQGADGFVPGVLVRGLDPAGVLMAGGDPLAVAAREARQLGAARLSDASSAGRRPAGGGAGERARLDVAVYGATLESCGYVGAVIADLRGAADVHLAGERVVAVWRGG